MLMLSGFRMFLLKSRDHGGLMRRTKALLAIIAIGVLFAACGGTRWDYSGFGITAENSCSTRVTIVYRPSGPQTVLAGEPKWLIDQIARLVGPTYTAVAENPTSYLNSATSSDVPGVFFVNIVYQTIKAINLPVDVEDLNVSAREAHQPIKVPTNCELITP